MSRHVSTGSIKNRPSPLSTKSFTRYEPSTPQTTNTRGRASTIQSTGSIKSPRKGDGEREDIFDKKVVEENEPPSPELDRTHSLPEKFDELPIELASLTDRFVESLSAKVYNEPPTIDHLAELFQEFYIRASSSVSIHISALMSRLNREPTIKIPPSPKPSAGKKGKDTTAAIDKSVGAQLMLTPSEVAEKRRARKLLEYKRILLEEAVERRACEKIYDKIWRHKSTLDEVRDEKLRSKTGALALVGIGLKDLGIELDSKSTTTLEDLQESLAPAREDLAKMNDERYPLGKLRHLTTAHKAIVDTLYTIHPSSSSADEILPTLIYTLITSPMEGINIISNLYFIQRFRASAKIDGEAAYCLTNLEAAISFLENVDLSSLRADEVPEGPGRTPSQPSTPANERTDLFPPLLDTTATISSPVVSTTPSMASGTNSGAVPTPNLKLRTDKPVNLPSPRHQRTLSDLLQPITNANEAVRSTAEEGFKNISNTLDNSFKFLFGKLKERSSEDASVEIIVPKTLDEARQLVSRPLTPDGEEVIISETSSIADKDGETSASSLTKTEEKILNLLGGRKAITSVRDRSVDSQKSNGSGKKVVFAATGSSAELSTSTHQQASSTSVTSTAQRPASTPTQSGLNPLDTVKNFGSSINPINHIGSAFGSALGRFGGRPSVSSPPIPPQSRPPVPTIDSTITTSNLSSSPTPLPQPALPSTKEAISYRTPQATELGELIAAPPITRFMEISDINELRIGEVSELLADYQRLARLLEELRVRAGDDDTDEEDSNNGEEADSENATAHSKGDKPG